MKIEVGKRYKSRMDDECKVIYRLEGGHTFPFVVIIKEDGTEMSENFTDNGFFRDDGITSPWDLCEEIPEPLKTAKETKAAEEPEEIAPDESCGPEKCNYCGKIKPRWNKSFGNIECKDCYWKRVAPLSRGGPAAGAPLNICVEDVEATYAHIKHPKEIYMRDKFTERHKEPLQMNADGSVKGWAPAEMSAENEAKGWKAFVPEGDTLRADKFADNLIAELDKEKEQCGDL